MLFCLLEEAKSEGIRLVAGAELDFHWLAEKLGKRLGHFPIEDERCIGVQFFLELKELVLSACPWSGLIHGEHKKVAAFVVRKGIENRGVGYAHRAGGEFGRGHEFLEQEEAILWS